MSVADFVLPVTSPAAMLAATVASAIVIAVNIRKKMFKLITLSNKFRKGI